MIRTYQILKKKLSTRSKGELSLKKTALLNH